MSKFKQILNIFAERRRIRKEERRKIRKSFWKGVRGCFYTQAELETLSWALTPPEQRKFELYMDNLIAKTTAAGIGMAGWSLLFSMADSTYNPFVNTLAIIFFIIGILFILLFVIYVFRP